MFNYNSVSKYSSIVYYIQCNSFNKTFPEEFTTLDVDTMMTGPDIDPPARTTEDLATIALANVEGIQELPHFESTEHAGADADTLNFSLLGATEDTTNSAV